MNDAIVLLDGMNLVNRAVYANMSSSSTVHNAVVFFRMVRSTIRQLHPKAVHIYWDTPSKMSWRSKIFPGYKNRKESIEGIKEQISKTKHAIADMLLYMNVHQFSKKAMEADDLIYAACRVLRPQKLIIVSSDSDYDQIPYHNDHVVIFDPKSKTFRETHDCDPALKKSLIGDTSDTVPGYNKIGPVNGAKLAKNPALLLEHLKTHGEEILRRNLMLIDLSLCPFNMHNMIYIRKKLSEPVEYDKAKVLETIKKYQINGIGSEISDILSIFGSLGETTQLSK